MDCCGRLPPRALPWAVLFQAFGLNGNRYVSLEFREGHLPNIPSSGLFRNRPLWRLPEEGRTFRTKPSGDVVEGEKSGEIWGEIWGHNTIFPCEPCHAPNLLAALKPVNRKNRIVSPEFRKTVLCPPNSPRIPLCPPNSPNSQRSGPGRPRGLRGLLRSPSGLPAKPPKAQDSSSPSGHSFPLVLTNPIGCKRVSNSTLGRETTKHLARFHGARDPLHGYIPSQYLMRESEVTQSGGTFMRYSSRTT
jgi:hypothetical protein